MLLRLLLRQQKMSVLSASRKLILLQRMKKQIRLPQKKRLQQRLTFLNLSFKYRLLKMLVIRLLRLPLKRHLRLLKIRLLVLSHLSQATKLLSKKMG